MDSQSGNLAHNSSTTVVLTTGTTQDVPNPPQFIMISQEQFLQMQANATSSGTVPAKLEIYIFDKKMRTR